GTKFDSGYRAHQEVDVLEDQNMSVQEAAAVVQDARARARKELVISTPLVYMAWAWSGSSATERCGCPCAGSTPTRGPRVSRSRRCSCWPVSRSRPCWSSPTRQLQASTAGRCDTAASSRARGRSDT